MNKREKISCVQNILKEIDEIIDATFAKHHIDRPKGFLDFDDRQLKELQENGNKKLIDDLRNSLKDFLQDFDIDAVDDRKIRMALNGKIYQMSQKGNLSGLLKGRKYLLELLKSD